MRWGFPHVAPALWSALHQRPGPTRFWCVMPKQPKSNGTPGKKPPAPSVKVRMGRTPLEQRSGSKPLEPSVQRRGIDETETGLVRSLFRHGADGDRIELNLAASDEG